MLQAGNLQQESGRSKASRKGKLLQAGKLQQESSRSKASRKGKLLQAGKLQQESGRSKASRKVKVAPSIEVMEEIPQPEAVEKQVNWRKNVKPATKPQLASGVAGTAGLFVHHVQLSVGDDGFCAGTFATVGT